MEIVGSRARSGVVALGIALLMVVAAGPRAAAAPSGWDPDRKILANGEIQVHFALGTTKRLLDKRGQHLLYPGPTSINVLRVNGRDYALGGKRTPRSRMPTYRGTRGASSVTLSYPLSSALSVDVTYTLAGPSVRMATTVRNQGTTPFEADFRYLLDTQVGRNDGSPFAFLGRPPTTLEQAWDGAPFTTWFGYDRYPSPRVNALGRFETPPDRVLLGYWRKVNPNAYAYRTTGLDFKKDSSLLAYYHLGTIAPGATSRSVALHYGSAAPQATNSSAELVRRLRALAEVVRAKYRQDLQTLAEVDALAIDAITESRTLQASTRHLAGEHAESGAQFVFETLIDEVFNKVSGADLVAGTTQLGIGLIVDSGLYAMEQGQTSSFFRDHFEKYKALWVTSAGDGGSVRAYVRRVLGAELGDEASRAVQPLLGLAGSLEQGATTLPEDYPFEVVYDALDRCTEALTLSVEKEVVVPTLSSSGRGLHLSMLGTLGPFRVRVQALKQLEDFGRGLDTSSKVTTYVGIGLGAAAKIGAFFLSGGISAALETFATVAGTTAFAVSQSTKIAGATVDVGSDASHYVQAALAYRAWGYERKHLPPLLGDLARGVAEIPKPEESDVRLEMFEVADGGNEAADVRRFRGRLVLHNAGASPAEVRVLVAVPSETKGATPLFAALPVDTTLQPLERQQKDFELVVPNPQAIADRPLMYRARAYVSAGPDDIRISATTFQFAPDEHGLDWQTTTLHEGELRTGQAWDSTIRVDPGTDSVVLYLDYEGSDLDLHVEDAAGHRVGVDYQLGRVVRTVARSEYTSDPGQDVVTLRAPAAGTYKIRVNSLASHRNESFRVSLQTRKAPARPMLALRPSVLYFAPNDRPDLVSIDLAELGGAAGGEVRVGGLDASAWRVSGPLRPGGSVRLEIRRPADAWRGGARQIAVSCGDTTATLRFEGIPEGLRDAAERLATRVNAGRQRRAEALRRVGEHGDLWEDAAFGRYSRPERAREAARLLMPPPREPRSVPQPVAPSTPRPGLPAWLQGWFHTPFLMLGKLALSVIGALALCIWVLLFRR